MTLLSNFGSRFAPIVCAIALAGCNADTSKDWNLKVGDPVPAFALQNVNGDKVSSEGLHGKPYVITIFATWCPPCKMELAALEQHIWQPLKDSGVSVVAINYGDEDPQTISEFVRSNQLSFPVLVDEPGAFRQTAGVTMVPQSMVVGADGKIVALHVGYTDESIKQMSAELQESK